MDDASTLQGSLHGCGRRLAVRCGFTLIELMIVIAIIAIIAAIAIPNLLESRITAAESTASSNLRTGVFSGQEVFRAAAHNDMDGDNRGEYGHLGHLSGAVATWGYPTGNVAGLAAGGLLLLSEDFAGGDPARHQPGTTTDTINGYLYASFLDADSTTDPAVDRLWINNAESYFAAAAVPEVYSDSGRRAFTITNAGQVLTASGSSIYNAKPGEVLNSAVNGIACFDTVENAVTRDNRSPYWSNR